jgi:hypothetical protein
VPAHADDHAAVERRVGLPVSTAVETVASVGLAGPGRDRAGAAQLREGGFGPDPVGVVAGGGEELAGDVGADAERLDQPWGGLLGEGLELAAVDLDLLVQLELAAGQGAECVTHGVAWRSGRRRWPTRRGQ